MASTGVVQTHVAVVKETVPTASFFFKKSVLPVCTPSLLHFSEYCAHLTFTPSPLSVWLTLPFAGTKTKNPENGNLKQYKLNNKQLLNDQARSSPSHKPFTFTQTFTTNLHTTFHQQALNSTLQALLLKNKEAMGEKQKAYRLKNKEQRKYVAFTLTLHHSNLCPLSSSLFFLLICSGSITKYMHLTIKNKRGKCFLLLSFTVRLAILSSSGSIT